MIVLNSEGIWQIKRRMKRIAQYFITAENQRNFCLDMKLFTHRTVKLPDLLFRAIYVFDVLLVIMKFTDCLRLKPVDLLDSLINMKIALIWALMSRERICLSEISLMLSFFDG